LGEALVEPDVLPLGQGHAVAEPLVGELVHDHRVAVGRGGEEELGVDGAGLGLQRELEVVVVVDDAAAGRERVAAEPPLEEVEDLVLAGEPAGRDLRLAGDDRAVVGVDEPGLDGEAGAEDELLGDRHAVVADHGGEPVTLRQPVP